METVSLAGQCPGMWIERIRREGSFTMATQHFQSYYEVYYLLEGERLYFLDNKVYRIRPGGLVFISPEQIHRTIGEGVHERILLHMERSVVSRVAQTLTGVSFSPLLSMPSVVLRVGHGEAGGLLRHLVEMLGEMKRGAPGGEEVAFLRMADLLIGILRCLSDRSAVAAAEESKRHREIYEIADFITANYAGLRSLDELCARFYISKSHLCREFKRITGLTVQEYLAATRIKHARQLLLEGKRSVTEVAEEVGYNSITHFERVFKKQMGEPPLAFRRGDRR